MPHTAGRVLTFALSLCLLACGGSGSSHVSSAGAPSAPAPAATILVTEASTSDPAQSIPSGSTDGHHLAATDFGTVGNQLGDLIGKQVDRSYRIQNAGRAPVAISGVSLEGPAADQFVLAQAPEGAPLAPGASTVFQLSWRPLPHAVLGDNVATVRVRGEGVDYTFNIVGTMVDSGHH